MAIRKLGRVGSLQEEFPDVAVPERTGHERVADAFFVKLTFSVEDIFADAAEDVVGKLIGAEQVGNRLVDPDVQLDLIVLDIGIADQVDTIERTQDVLGLHREAHVGLAVARPFVAVPFDHQFEKVVDHWVPDCRGGC